MREEMKTYQRGIASARNKIETESFVDESMYAFEDVYLDICKKIAIKKGFKDISTMV